MFCADRFILRVLTEECLILTPVGAAGNACENLKYKANIACQARLLLKFTRLVKYQSDLLIEAIFATFSS